MARFSRVGFFDMIRAMVDTHLQFALVGAGEFGNFAQTVLDHVADIKLVAVVDTNEKAASDLAKHHNAPTFSTLDELLEKMSVDFIMINTPNDTHYSLITTALQHNVGVFCEKPLVIHSEEVSELFALAKPGLLDVDMVLRESLGYQYLKSYVDSRKDLPKKIYIENRATEAQIQASWYWDDARSGGWFYTSAIHFIDLIFFLYPQVSFRRFWSHLDMRDGRAYGYEFVLEGEGIEFKSVHYFDTKEASKIGVDARFEYADTTIDASGWVPTDISWTHNLHPNFKLKTDRETEYRQMVARRLQNFCNGMRKGEFVVTEEEIKNVSVLCELLNKAAYEASRQWQTIV